MNWLWRAILDDLTNPALLVLIAAGTVAAVAAAARKK